MTTIRKIRETKEFSIKDVATICDIPVTTLYDVETGRKGVLAKRAQKISDLLGEPLDRLFIPTYYRAKIT
ncbi:MULTISPECIES: helix-turn-helix domain-containing protein [Bacillus cereus group]|uniref:helix-turn-helix domain-containing protein n=1 Tax=Bacillus cereus group TaxID=86661 RepID=UPI000A3773D4|nr:MULTISPECIES: helix-turn-helix transcriptional regulator [Bacillus cereus group]MED3273292.1 helix-turn-helix transcriptional regulator [Bacillus thuringiensis]MBJ8024209.1 helix-turn-helix transcriptional regulator [Bacillus cereus]MBJ8036768.1 helix-turn-helix transcriptional regulator [Bacillus cereus]OTW52876.1 transcriptional regulator [Bacillus thuringiensis serovar silo]OTW63384.1 transcriptional regulator [Bacillus thuringiensis serovar toguchini]